MADNSTDTADLLGLSDLSTSSGDAAKATSPALSQQPKSQPLSRKVSSSRRERKKEKLYQGRASAQKQNTESSSPPWAQKPKLKLKQPKRLSQSNISTDLYHQSQTELNRPKRLSQSNLTGRRRSLSSVGSDLTDDLDDGPSAKQQPFHKKAERRKSRSSSPMVKKSKARRPSLQRDGDYALQRRPSVPTVHPSLQRRPSVQRRPSTQKNSRPQLLRRNSATENSSRSLLAGSLQDNGASFHRSNSMSASVPVSQGEKFFETLHVPMKDDQRQGRGRSRNNNEDGKVRRRSRSFDADAYGCIEKDLIAVENEPMNDKPRNRRRASSWDSGSEHSSFNPIDFEEEIKKSRANNKTDQPEKRRANKKPDESEKRTRHSMPTVPTTKKVEDENKKKRHSMPSSKKPDRGSKKPEVEFTEVKERDSKEAKDDLENRKAAIKAGVQARTRRSMPTYLQQSFRKIKSKTAEDEDKRKRHSMPATIKKGRSDPNSQREENKFEAGGSSPGRRTNRRVMASTGYSRLHQSINQSVSKALNKRRRPPPTPPPVPLAAADAGSSTREADEEIVPPRRGSETSEGSYRRRKKKRGCYVSRFMMAMMCLCYLFSLAAVFAVGFWVHMDFFAYKDTDTTVNKNAGVLQGTNNSIPEILGDSNATATQLRPHSPLSSPSSPPESTSSVNPQQFPIDGGLGTKVSQIPAAVATNHPSLSSSPTPIVSDSPSSTPTSSSYPTSTPSIPPTVLASESPSFEPTVTRSESPSFSPTMLDECPETLSKSMPFISDTALTLYYETVIYRDHPTGGLFCASLEYSGSAGWIGIAFSTAGRNPEFGRREAVIGMPGVETAVATSAGNVTISALNPSGSQNNVVEGGPYFINPGKYEIPAGGLEGYYGPSLQFLMSDYHQTLVNASVTTLNESNETVTRLSFAKYLREPGEIKIKPLGGPTLILYAVAPIDPVSGLYIDENPQWKYINMILGGRRSNTRSSLVRKREHNNTGD